MGKYNCDKCVNYGIGGVFNRNKRCAKCTVDTKNLKAKPSNFQENNNTEEE